MKNRLQIIREKNDLTQREMAKILHISKTYYNYFETQERIITLKYLNNFCNYFSLSMDYIFYLSDYSINSKELYKINKIEVGKRIRNIRIKNKLTQTQLAKIINTTQSTISSYESGKTLILTVFLYEISVKFNVSMDYLSGRSNIIKTYLK